MIIRAPIAGRNTRLSYFIRDVSQRSVWGDYGPLLLFAIDAANAALLARFRQ